MERRYTLIERTGVRNIEGYNKEILENPEYRDDPDYQKCSIGTSCCKVFTFSCGLRFF